MFEWKMSFDELISVIWIGFGKKENRKKTKMCREMV